MTNRTMRHHPALPSNILPNPHLSNRNKTGTGTIPLLIPRSTSRLPPHYRPPPVHRHKTTPNRTTLHNLTLTKPYPFNHSGCPLNSSRRMNGPQSDTNPKNHSLLLHFPPRLNNNHHRLQPQAHPSQLLPICNNDHSCFPYPKRNQSAKPACPNNRMN